MELANQVNLRVDPRSIDRSSTSSKSSPKLGHRTVGDMPLGDTPGRMSPGADNDGSRRLQQIQDQVDHVVDIMQVNVDNILERDRVPDELQAGREQFEASAQRLQRRSIGSYLISIVKVVAIIVATPVVLTAMMLLVTGACTVVATGKIYTSLKDRGVNRIAAFMCAGVGGCIGGGIAGLVFGPFMGIAVECTLIKTAAQGRSVCEKIKNIAQGRYLNSRLTI
ncbi:hypothetical protein GCM10023116_19040 [Kistimonas scapharcae]|uniref:V-SNARE coiled-coil homology domain-containing protein n=1 Tax=Kistimonas scapharcae TaxID=1036133 RepID=A0ABP8V2H5_9GAMM